VARLVKLALVQLRTGKPERVKRPATLVGAGLAPQCVRDQGFGGRSLAQSAVSNAGVHDQLRLVEVGHP
jgi:hypothetical protein